MADDLLDMIARLESDYKSEIAKWEGLKQKHLSEIKTTEQELLDYRRKLEVLMKQKRKLQNG